MAPPGGGAMSSVDACVGRRLGRRVGRRVLLATVVPVVLMGVGATLVVHAHLRSMAERGGRLTALQVARAALEGASGPKPNLGVEQAVMAASSHGLLAHLEPGAPAEGEPSCAREADGQVALRVPLSVGVATVRYSPDVRLADSSGLVLVGTLGAFWTIQRVALLLRGVA